MRVFQFPEDAALVHDVPDFSEVYRSTPVVVVASEDSRSTRARSGAGRVTTHANAGAAPAKSARATPRARSQRLSGFDR